MSYSDSESEYSDDLEKSIRLMVSILLRDYQKKEIKKVPGKLELEDGKKIVPLTTLCTRTNSILTYNFRYKMQDQDFDKNHLLIIKSFTSDDFNVRAHFELQSRNVMMTVDQAGLRRERDWDKRSDPYIFVPVRSNLSMPSQSIFADPDAHYHSNELNGNNGESTNTDDLSGIPDVGSKQWANSLVAQLHQTNDYWNPLQHSSIDNYHHSQKHLPKFSKVGGDAINAVVGLTSTPLYAAASKAYIDATSTKNKFSFAPLKRNSRYQRDKAILAIKPKITAKEFDSKQKASRLNGNNGSATNSDDVKPSKTQRAIQSARDKARNGNVSHKKNVTVRKMAKAETRAIQKSYVSRGPAVSSSYVANSMTNIAEVRPGTRVIKALKNGLIVETTISLGNQGLAGASSTSSIYNEGQVISSLLVDRVLFSGTEMDQFQGAYENCTLIPKFTKLALVSANGINTNGLYAIMTDPDSVDQLPPLVTLDLNTVASHLRPKQRSVGLSDANIPVSLNKAKLWTDPQITEFTSLSNVPVPTTDVRLNAAGVINVILGVGIPTTVTTLGNLWLTARYKLWNSQRSELSNLVYNGRVISTNNGGDDMLAAGTVTSAGNFDMAGLISVCATDPKMSACEYAYNPKFLQPNRNVANSSLVLKLPIGSYQLNSAIFFKDAGASFSLIPAFTNCTGDFNQFDNVEGSWPAFMDFSAAYQSASGLSGGTLCKGAMNIRITSVSGNNGLGTLTITFRATSAGSLLVCMAHLNIVRIPTIDTNPIACFFPHGSKNQNVGLSQRETNLLELFHSGDHNDQDSSATSLYRVQDGNMQVICSRYGLPVFTYLQNRVKEMTKRAFESIDKDPEVIHWKRARVLEPDTPEEKLEPLSSSVHLSKDEAKTISSLWTKLVPPSK